MLGWVGGWVADLNLLTPWKSILTHLRLSLELAAMIKSLSFLISLYLLTKVVAGTHLAISGSGGLGGTYSEQNFGASITVLTAA